MSTSASRRTSVLIVEDEGIVAEDLQQTLAAFGFDAYAVAGSAEEAIDVVTARCPDVVLMDIRIRGRRDGIETATMLREQFGVPIVFLTAHSDTATLARARTAEPHAYLTKPVRPDELRSAIELADYRSQIERRLQQRERWLATTLESITDAVITVDLAGCVASMNAEAERLTGLVLADAMGRPSSELVELLDRSHPAAMPGASLDVAINERCRDGYEHATLWNAVTGEARRVLLSSTPLVESAKTVGAVMMFREVSDERAGDASREPATRLGSLATMASGVSHEINNPLTVVASNAAFAREELAELRELLARHDLLAGPVAHRVDELVQAAADIVAAGDRIAKIVSDLRSFAHREPPSQVRGADVQRAVVWAIRATAPRVGALRVTTSSAVVPHVTGDEVRLGHVLAQLIVNAAQAYPAGTSDGEIAIAITAPTPAHVVVTVTDRGCGIPEAIRDRVFEPFFTTRGVGHAGLGLSIAHGIVTSFGGTIALEPPAHAGTTVRLTLAADAAPAPHVPPAIVPSTRRARILVIDDDPLVLRGIARMLRAYEVLTHACALDALDLLAGGTQFDLIVSDLMMPRMTGVEFFEELVRGHPDLARRVVFITGGALTARTDEFLRALPNTCLEKPFDAATLQAFVASRLATS